ncbi:MAG: esterase family protein [Alphaproteobacteria bacterium]|nr:esterase family protein [Alphaproteobacteria bacterium]
MLIAACTAAAPNAPATTAAGAPNGSPLVPLALNRDGNFHIAPPYAPDPVFTEKPNVPKGHVVRFEMNSDDSKIYPTTNGADGKPAPYKRPVVVYIPFGYRAGTPAPFIVVQDGVHWYGGGLPNRPDLPYIPTMLDNLIVQHRVPAMVAIMIDPGPGPERSIEYDAVSDRYTQFIEKEVLPRIAKDYGIIFTTDPEGRAAFGESSGSAAAIAMAWFHPELYRRIISYSGTFVALRRDPNAAPDGAWEYHEHFIPNTPRKPMRIWMEVGEHDNGYQTPEENKRNWVIANRHMAEVLAAKGYPYQFVFADDVAHVSRPVEMQTMPEAFEWAWKGYRGR